MKVGVSRERVAPLLDPPVTTKTLERWEKGISPLPDWRRVQLEGIYDGFASQAKPTGGVVS